MTSVRGAHGGYRLAKPADEIAMLDVVEALEGPIAPMECFHSDREGRVLCSHEADDGHACATKLLWTRVHGGVTKALAEHHARRPGRVRRPAPSPREPARSPPSSRHFDNHDNWRPWLTSKFATCT